MKVSTAVQVGEVRKENRLGCLALPAWEGLAPGLQKGYLVSKYCELLGLEWTEPVPSLRQPSQVPCGLMLLSCEWQDSRS